MRRLRWVAAVVGLVALDVYFLGWRLNEVLGNVEAQFIIVTPAFVVSHLLHKRRSDRQHADQVGRQEAHAVELAAHRRDMATVAEKVAEIHALHLHGTWPEDRHRGR
jgi:hypothetical protein